MNVDIQPVSRDELPLFVRIFEVAALEAGGEAETATLIAYLEEATCLGAKLGDRLVATAAHYDVELTVPGGAAVPASAVTMVATLPTHTRKGISTALMRRQLADQRQGGRVAAVLEASEGRIYGRFGYGAATWHLTAGMRVGAMGFHDDLDDDGSFEYAEDEAIVHFAAPLWDGERALRPGRLSRPANWWAMTLFDPPGWRQGGGPLTAVFHVDAAGTPDAYALYRITPQSEGHVSQAEVKVHEVVAANPHARALMWRWLLTIDLTGTVMVDGLAADDPLWWLAADIRQVRAVSSRDGLWVRLLDVPAALQARGWLVDDTSFVLDVTDPILADNTGRYRVTVKDGAATCDPADGEADVTLGVDVLGALYLGGVDARTLGAAGRLTAASPESLASVARAFASDVPPHHLGGF